MIDSWLPTGGVLEDDVVAIGVDEGAAFFIPVGVMGGDGLVAEADEFINGGLPFIFLGKVKDEEMFIGGGWGDDGAVFVGKFEVVAEAGVAEHEAIEAVVVFEVAEDGEAETLTVEGRDSLDIIGGAGNAQVYIHRIPRFFVENF